VSFLTIASFATPFDAKAKTWHDDGGRRGIAG
jgi:hypothetical protein